MQQSRVAIECMNNWGVNLAAGGALYGDPAVLARSLPPGAKTDRITVCGVRKDIYLGRKDGRNPCNYAREGKFRPAGRRDLLPCAAVATKSPTFKGMTGDGA
jgi:hypothetical protein